MNRVTADLAAGVGVVCSLEWEGSATTVELDVQRTSLRRFVGFSSLRSERARSIFNLSSKCVFFSKSLPLGLLPSSSSVRDKC